MDLVTLALYGAFAAFWVFVLHRGYPANVVVLTTMWATLLRYLLRGGAPLRPHWTLWLELTQAVMRAVVDRFGDGAVRPHYALKLRDLSARLGNLLGGFSCRAHGTEATPVVVNGLEHLWLRASGSGAKAATSQPTRPKSPVSTGAAGAGAGAANGAARRFVVLYYHGGGYTLNSPRFYVSFCNSLRDVVVKELERAHQVEKPQVDFLLANYRKAPEHKFPVPAQDAVAIYKHLITDQGLSPRQIILAGDSAGGGLVLSVMLRLRQSQPGLLPLAGVLMCPKTSMAKGSSDGAATPLCVLSPLLVESFRTAYHKTPNDPSTWQDASPVHCNLRDLPPMFLQTGTLDYLHAEALEIFAKVRADGIGNWELDVHEHMPHIFAFLPTFVLPYAQVGVASMGKYIARQFASTLSSRAKYIKHKRASQGAAA